MVKNLLILAISLFLTACTTTEEYSDHLNQWRGKHIDTAIYKWGYPTRDFQAPNGNTVYVFDKRIVVGTGPIVVSAVQTKDVTVQSSIGSDTTGYKGCRVMAEIDNKKNILNVVFDGRCKKGQFPAP